MQKSLCILILSLITVPLLGMQHTQESVERKISALKEKVAQTKAPKDDAILAKIYDRLKEIELLMEAPGDQEFKLLRTSSIINSCTIDLDLIENYYTDRPLYTIMEVDRTKKIAKKRVVPSQNSSPFFPKIFAYLCGTGLCAAVSLYSYKFSPQVWYRPFLLTASGCGGSLCLLAIVKNFLSHKN